MSTPTPPTTPDATPSRPSATPHCHNCGCDLTGMTIGSACPECGVTIEDLSSLLLIFLAGRRTVIQLLVWCHTA